MREFSTHHCPKCEIPNFSIVCINYNNVNTSRPNTVSNGNRYVRLFLASDHTCCEKLNIIFESSNINLNADRCFFFIFFLEKKTGHIRAVF